MNPAYVDFSGFTEVQVITALYNSTTRMGLGRLVNDQTLTEQDILDELHDGCIDYLKGRPLKVNLKKFPLVSSAGYDRDSPTKMKDVLKKMREGQGNVAFVKEEMVPAKKVIAEADKGLRVTIGGVVKKKKEEKSTYIGCAKLGYCAYATDEYIKSNLHSKEYMPICLKFYIPSYKEMHGHVGKVEVETSIMWKGKPYGTHVALFNPHNYSWIDPLYDVRFDTEHFANPSKEYIEFLVPKIEWGEEGALCVAIQPLSSINYNSDGEMKASNWDPDLHCSIFVYKNKECFQDEQAEVVLNAEYEKLKKQY
tara:strand:- start:336 stop:1262 length:927 start_codon:yes stop_codon:yes gene_type:complete